MIIEENIDLKLLDCFFQFFFSCKTYTKIKMHKKINIQMFSQIPRMIFSDLKNY